MRFCTLGWKPKNDVFYRSWSGDGRHNVIVEALIDGLRYPAAFKICRYVDASNTARGGVGCDIWIWPEEYSQTGRKGRIPQNILNRSFNFFMPKESVKFHKKQRKETLFPTQGYRTTFVDFKTITYEVEVKELPVDVRMRFISWQNSL